MQRRSSTMKRSNSTSSIEFPTLAQAAGAKQEISHYSHSKHPLTEIITPEIFRCSGCREYGAGKRFSCRHCDFQLHVFCALSPPVFNDHPLHAQHQLVFHSKPRSAKGGMSWSRCDVCGKSAKGFALRCGACSFQMHPCCAMLSTRINVAVHPHALTLLPTDSHYYCSCNECSGKRKSGRIYRCTTCEDNESYYLHAACAKSFINGLHDNGIPTPQKPSALGTAARVASQVVTEFIGGLFEGIGEGVAEALLQNIMPRGRRQLHHN